MMELMNVNMKKIISLLLPAVLLFCSAGNASGEAAETDCYRAGPVTKTFGTVKLENRQLIFEADSEAN